MSESLKKIKEQFAKFASQYGPDVIRFGEAIQINDDDTIQVELLDGAVIPDVRLKPLISDGNYVIVSPVVNTSVLIAAIENSDEYVLLCCDQPEEVRIKIGQTELIVNSTGVKMQKGGDSIKDILTLIIDAVTPIAVLYGNNPDYIKLGQAKTKVNNLLS